MKKLLSVLLCVVLAVSCFAGCSKKVNADFTEENITETISVVNEALNNFDLDDLHLYVNSPLLPIITGYAQKHDQFVDLGKAIFANLTLEVESIDLENKTVTVSAHNKELSDVASAFASELNDEFSTVQLLQKLSDDDFLDAKLNILTKGIDSADMQKDKSTIVLDIDATEDHLVICFDEDDENIISGGALSAIKAIYS